MTRLWVTGLLYLLCLLQHGHAIPDKIKRALNVQAESLRAGRSPLISPDC